MKRDASPSSGAYTATTFPQDPVVLVCEQCGRRGVYRLASLAARFGANTAMPDILKALANCPRWRDMSDPCRAHYEVKPGAL